MQVKRTGCRLVRAVNSFGLIYKMCQLLLYHHPFELEIKADFYTSANSFLQSCKLQRSDLFFPWASLLSVQFVFFSRPLLFSLSFGLIVFKNSSMPGNFLLLVL